MTKVYDGTTSASAIPVIVTGLMTGDVSIAGVSGNVYFGGSTTTGKAPKEATIWLSPFEVRWN